MRTVSLVDAKTRFSTLLAAAEAGEEIVLTRQGRAVVRLLPGGGRGGGVRELSPWGESQLFLDALSGAPSDLISPLD